MQPGAEPGPRLEFLQLGIGADERVLHHVLGVGFVAGDAVGHAEDGTAVPLDERAKCLPISGPRLGEDECLSVHVQKVRRGELRIVRSMGLWVHGSMGRTP